MSHKYVTQLVAVLVPVIVCEGCGAEGVATPTAILREAILPAFIAALNAPAEKEAAPDGL